MKHPKFIDGLPDEVTAAKALSHSVRRQLLDALHQRGPLTSRELAAMFGVEIQSVNHHLRTLGAARFVRTGDASVRGNIVEHVYYARLQARVKVWDPHEQDIARG